MDATGIQAIVTGSNTILTWCLSIIAGSVVAILGTGYVRPMGKWTKLIYLIYFPAWSYLAFAIYWGDSLTRRGIMAAIDPSRIAAIEEKMNYEFAYQLNDFRMAIFCFGLWLILYLTWWVIQDFFPKLKDL